MRAIAMVGLMSMAVGCVEVGVLLEQTFEVHDDTCVSGRTERESKSFRITASCGMTTADPTGRLNEEQRCLSSGAAGMRLSGTCTRNEDDSVDMNLIYDFLDDCTSVVETLEFDLTVAPGAADDFRLLHATGFGREKPGESCGIFPLDHGTAGLAVTVSHLRIEP